MVCDVHAASVGGGEAVVVLPTAPDVEAPGAVVVVVVGALREVELPASVSDVVEEPTMGAAT
jgi:hypothetical protein